MGNGWTHSMDVTTVTLPVSASSFSLRFFASVQVMMSAGADCTATCESMMAPEVLAAFSYFWIMDFVKGASPVVSR